jgi:NADH-quinone oxidoreductase subunit L
VLDLVWLIPALPLAGFLLLLVAGRKLGDPWAGWLATLMVAGSFAASVVVFAGLHERAGDNRQFTQDLFTWFSSGGLHVTTGFLVDPLSITMALFVTGVGTLIHLYSIGYMKRDPRFSTFFVYMNLFAFSMLMLVLGDNLLVTFLGWEGVGACSYFLISFWFTKEANATAGKKAFVTNRVGDWGFMLAMFLAFSALGTLQYAGPQGILARAPELTAVTATGIAGLLFLGACGKSAQLPLYVWLPDAMAGPTPVSALIHAATMVTAGVYLMVRINPILAQSHSWLPTLIAVVGGLTALFAATIAVAQNDIKRVLAYSTISQLGYMFLAVGSGAYVAAIFHMVTHAFFKALLFLGSGSVIHGLHDEQDMRRMGALKKFMPITAATFIVGWLAIAGLPPFAGFWSKDDILANAWDKSPALWAIGFVTAGLTAYYMSRQVFMVFFGDARWDEARPPAEAADEHADDHPHAVTPHESSWPMTVPLVVLAVLSVVGGLLNTPFAPVLERWLEPVFAPGALHELTLSTTAKVAFAVITSLLAIGGILAARAVYLRKRVPADKVEPGILLRAWGIDAAISKFVGGPGAEAFELTAAFDRNVVDGAVNGTGELVQMGGRKLRLAQSGYVRNYALGIAVGAVILVGLFLGRA